MTREVDQRLVDSDDESPEVRELLRAGIVDRVLDYDFDAGLGAHLAAIQPPPLSAPDTTAPMAPASGMSLKALLGWLALPAVAASIGAAWWATHRGDVASEPAAVVQQSAAQNAPRNSTTETPRAALRGESPGDDAHDQSASERAEARNTPPGSTPQGTSPSQEGAETSASRGQGAHPQTKSVGVSTRVATAEQLARKIVEEPQARGATSSGASSLGARAEATEAQVPVRSANPDSASATSAGSAARAAEARPKVVEAPVEEPPAKVVIIPPAEERLKREMSELSKARQALADSPAEALAIARRGEREFGASLFSEERQHVLILALIGLGRMDEAEKRAVPYLRAHPGSPFARRVERALAAAKARSGR